MFILDLYVFKLFARLKNIFLNVAIYTVIYFLQISGKHIKNYLNTQIKMYGRPIKKHKQIK